MLIVRTLLLIGLAGWACCLALRTASAQLKKSTLVRWGTVGAAVVVSALYVHDAIGQWHAGRASNEHYQVTAQIEGRAESIEKDVVKLGADVGNVTGMVSSLAEDVRAGNVSRPAFNRLARPLRELLSNMAGVVERAADPRGDAVSIGTQGWRIRPKVSAEEEEKLLRQIHDALSKLDLLAAGG